MKDGMMDKEGIIKIIEYEETEEGIWEWEGNK